MAITLCVVAPEVPEETIMELSQSLGAEFHTAVSTFGTYGTEGKTPSIWIEGLPELINRLDSIHFWTIVKISVTPAMVKAGNKLVDKLVDVAVDWAVRYAKGGKKAKILIYGPDNQPINEIDG